MSAPSPNLSQMLLANDNSGDLGGEGTSFYESLASTGSLPSSTPDNESSWAPTPAMGGTEAQTVRQFDMKLNQVCGLLLQLTDEQRETNILLRKLINEENPGTFQIIQMPSQDRYIRFLVVLENDRSRPRMNCPLCGEDVEITTTKRGGCKQQSFCGDYIVCNECTNDALSKVLRCPQCCETYSNIPVPLCSHLTAVTNSEGHLARKGSGSGCPICSHKLVKDKCPQDCARKDLPNYNMAKTILSERVFVLVKNPEACSTQEDDRPCSHYCRCTKHNILFTNRNRGAKCRECTKENSRQKQLGKRKRTSNSSSSGSTPARRGSSTTGLQSLPPNDFAFTHPVGTPAPQQQPPMSPAQIQAQQHSMNMNMRRPVPSTTPGVYANAPYPTSLEESLEFAYPGEQNLHPGGSQNTWLSLNNVKELGKRVHLDDLFDRIPYSEGVMEFGKRVTSSLGFGGEDQWGSGAPPLPSPPPPPSQ